MDTLASIGRYEIKRRVGSGAMGDIYEAHDPLIDRRVAIKVLRRELVERVDDSAGWIGRFRQEARAAGRLLHPNIITLLDYGEQAGTPFFAMEFFDGENLDVLLKRNGRFAGRDALAVVRQVLSALDFAHAHGVIHRDVKPSNIMLTNTGLAKIADFGIAHIEASDLTSAGDVLGTPCYMAPEQLSGGVVDGRTDLFATGVVLFELLSGVKPFGTNLGEIWINMERRGPADIRVLNPEVTPALQCVIEIALAFDPSKRYASVAEFSLALAETESKSGPPAGDGQTIGATIVRGPRPAAGAALGPTLGGDLLAEVERDLAHAIGPLARIVVQRSVKTVRDLAALYGTLATYIEDEAERTNFLRKGEQRAGSSLPPASGISAGAARSGAGNARPAIPIAIAPETLHRLEVALTQYIGPIARVVLRKQLLKSASLTDLCSDLAAHIPNERDRAAFLESQRGG
jgi:tRNA A-37 threonylcarbamoyl transferase component Bud32